MSTRDKFNVGVVLIAVALIVGYIVASIAFPDVNPVEFVLRMFMVFALVFGAALGGYAAFGALDDERKAKQQREGLFPYWRKESWLVYELVFPKPVDAEIRQLIELLQTAKRLLDKGTATVEEAARMNLRSGDFTFNLGGKPTTGVLLPIDPNVKQRSVSLSEIARNPKLSLAAEDYLRPRPVRTPDGTVYLDHKTVVELTTQGKLALHDFVILGQQRLIESNLRQVDNE